MAISNVRVESTQTTSVFVADGEQAITAMFFCNQSEVNDCKLDIYLVPAGDVATSATQVVKALDLPATETYVFDMEKIILDNLDSIQARATVDQIVVATVSSVSTL
jgi:hypothetical protein